MSKQLEINNRLEYFDNLKAKRQKWQSVWGDIKTYIIPQEKIKNEIFDSTARWAREQLASGLQSLLVNQSTNWFNVSLLKTEKEEIRQNDEVVKWCHDVGQTILGIFHNPSSNFYSQIHEFFLSLTAFGTSVFYIEEDLTLPSGVFFRNINLDECYFEDNRFGLVDSMYRQFSMNIKSARSKWPKEFKDSKDENVNILHIVTEAGSNQKFRYVSEYINFDTKKVLSTSGYDYFPFLVTRWIKESDAYGYSPAHHILPDVKVLNTLRKMSLESGQKQLRPPMLVPRDGYFPPLKTSQNSINFYRNGIADKIVPLIDVGSKMSTLDEERQCRDAILKAFYVDIFRMQKEHTEMTATEAHIRTEEQMRMMSPIVGRIETEFLNPLIINIYKILQKYGTIPTLSINNRNMTDIEVEYISPLSRVQKAASMSSIEQTLAFFARNGITSIYPQIYDNIDWDKIFRLAFKLRSAPIEILRTEDEVIAVRQQREQAMQMQQSIMAQQ